MPYQIGDFVTDSTFVRPDTTPFAWDELKAPVVLLVFLRHLA